MLVGEQGWRPPAGWRRRRRIAVRATASLGGHIAVGEGLTWSTCKGRHGDSAVESVYGDGGWRR